MKFKKAARRFVIPSIPAGAAIGYFVGYYGCLGVLKLQGKGSSHNDMITLVVAGGLAAVFGALTLPIITWSIMRNQK